MQEYSSTKSTMDELYQIQRTMEFTWVRRWRDKASSLFISIEHLKHFLKYLHIL